MENIKKIAILPLIVTIMLITLIAGCAGTADTPGPASTTTETEQQRLEKKLADAMTNFENLQSYTFDLVLNMDITGTGGTQPGNIVMETSSSGGINMDSKQMELKMLMSMTGDVPDMEEGLQNLGLDIYLIDNWTYMRVKMAEIGEQWMKANTTNPDEAFNINMAQKQVAVLDSPSMIEIIRTESVNGIECDVYSVTPDMASLAEWYNEQGNYDLENNIDYADVFKDFSILCYISQETNQLKRMSIEMNMQMTGEALDSAAEVDNVNINILMDMNIANENGAFTVVLPPEAENAIEVSEDMISQFR